MSTVKRVSPSLQTWAAAALLLLPLGVCAASNETGEPSNGKQLMFIPPPVEGVISVGVYDSRGKLIRVLKQAAEIDTFKAGLDGLFVDWDGADASGKPAPPGKYFVRGVLIGSVNISGVAYHLNDWVDDSFNLRVKSVSSPTLLSSRSLAVIADTGRPEILVIDPSAAAPRRLSVENGASRIKSDGSSILAIYPDHVTTLSLADQSAPEKLSMAGIRDADRSGGNWAILTDTQLRCSLNGQETVMDLPSPDINRCALLATSVILANADGKLWRTGDGRLDPVELDQPGQVLDLSAGAGDQISLLIQNGAKSVLRQVDLAAKTSKDINLPDGLQKVQLISASRSSSDLVLAADLNPGERVIGLHFQAAKDQQSVWEKWFDRSIVPFQFFDVKAGTVQRADSKSDSPPAMIRPANNPLENTRQAAFLLSAVADETGAHLATNDGLPLVQITKTKGINQIKWEASGTNAMKVYLSDGTVVEEYDVTGLENLYRFNAGSFD